MCTVNVTQSMNANFAITNVILSMQGSFTCHDIYEKVRNFPFDISEKTVLKIIVRLRENDYLDEIGHSYRVIPIEKSIRWGWN